MMRGEYVFLVASSIGPRAWFYDEAAQLLSIASVWAADGYPVEILGPRVVGASFIKACAA